MKTMARDVQNLTYFVQTNDLIHLPTTESILCGWVLNKTLNISAETDGLQVKKKKKKS